MNHGISWDTSQWIDDDHPPRVIRIQVNCLTHLSHPRMLFCGCVCFGLRLHIYIYIFIYICVYFFYNIHMKCQVKTHAPNNRWYLILLSLTFGDCSGLVKTLKHPKELHVCLRACWEFNLLGFSVPRWWASVILKFHTVSWCTRVPVISGCRWLVKPFTKHRKTEDPTWFIIYIYIHTYIIHVYNIIQ